CTSSTACSRWSASSRGGGSAAARPPGQDRPPPPPCDRVASATVDAQERRARVGIVGSGFRARTVLRVLYALPDRFEVAGVATRNAGDRAALAARGLPAAGLPGLPGLPAPAYTTVAGLLDD